METITGALLDILSTSIQDKPQNLSPSVSVRPDLIGQRSSLLTTEMGPFLNPKKNLQEVKPRTDENGLILVVT